MTIDEMLHKFLVDLCGVDMMNVSSLKEKNFLKKLDDMIAKLCEVSLIMGEYIVENSDDMHSMLTKFKKILEDCETEEDPNKLQHITEYCNELRNKLILSGEATIPSDKVIVREVIETTKPVYDETCQIAVVWSTCDVKNECVRPDLSDDQALDVLKLSLDKHDANTGINWDVLNIWAEYLYPKPDKRINIDESDLYVMINTNEGYYVGEVKCMSDDENFQHAKDSNKMIKAIFYKHPIKLSYDFQSVIIKQALRLKNSIVESFETNEEAVEFILKCAGKNKSGIEYAINRYYNSTLYEAASDLSVGNFAIIKNEEED